MYTKEQLEVAKAILLNLISDKRELDYEGLGICSNMYYHSLNKVYSIKKVFYFFQVKKVTGKVFKRIEAISLVAELAIGWKFHSGLFSWPVPENSKGLWEGTNLTLRIDLMKYIVGKIDELLEGM